MARNAKQMANIIDELLLLANMRRSEVQNGPLDMAQIIENVRQRLAYMIEENQAEITLPDTWPQAVGYGPWVEEVWANYISNAIKYGGLPPQIELGASLQLDGTARFWVKDNGAGLSPEQQARLFTPFTRVHQAKVEGHGLGLSIVQRIVERLGGTVGVESAVGQGSTFYFMLPCASNDRA
jgi:signal transduction histidine kinase